MFGRRCHIHGSRGGKALCGDELTGILGRLSARQACTWRPNTLWIMQKHFLVDVLGWWRKEVFYPSLQLMSKAGPGGKKACWDQTPRNQSVFPAATDSWAASRQGAEMGPVDPASGACFGGEFRILVGCRKQTLIG